MSLENLAKYQLDKESLSQIHGSGWGTVTCEDGSTFSASASSMEVVRDRGNFWCEHHGHGSGSSYTFMEVGEGVFTLDQ